jgi:hypothetical protein
LPGGEPYRFFRTYAAVPRKRVSDFRLVRKDFISGGALFDYTARSKGLDLEYYRSAFADGPRAFQVIVFGTPQWWRLRAQRSSR